MDLNFMHGLAAGICRQPCIALDQNFHIFISSTYKKGNLFANVLRINSNKFVTKEMKNCKKKLRLTHGRELFEIHHVYTSIHLRLDFFCVLLRKYMLFIISTRHISTLFILIIKRYFHKICHSVGY